MKFTSLKNLHIIIIWYKMHTNFKESQCVVIENQNIRILQFRTYIYISTNYCIVQKSDGEKL